MRNVFLAHNEYHLMISISIVLEHYNNLVKFDNRIYYAYKNIRVIDDFDVTKVPAVFFKIQTENNLNIRNELNDIINFKPHRFFYFQEGRPFNIYLVKKLYTIGATICLVQDGLKPYGIVRKRFELFIALRETIKSYKTLKAQKLQLKGFHLFRNYRYGITKAIHELWLSHPDSFINRYNKKIIPLPDLSQEYLNNIISDFFLFKEKSLFIDQWEKLVFYISTPLTNPKHLEAEWKFLDNLMEVLPNNNGILIKLHPVMNNSYVERYRQMRRAIVFKSPLPAELFLLQLHNSVVLSGWSTALLTYNSSCNFYYNYPIYERDKLLRQFQPSNPTNYIKVITDAKQISFPEV